jgi:hypothetical protein
MENNMWRIRYNEKINTLLKGEDIVRCMKSQRIRWLRHVERMEDNTMRPEEDGGERMEREDEE